MGCAWVSGPARSHQRQDVRCELRQRSVLVAAREVKHELLEAKLDVLRHPLDDLSRVVADDESRVSAVGGGVG